MARNLHGLAGFTAGPAVPATLGWFSLSAWFDRRRLMFLYGLVNLPNDNLYRMITVNRIIRLCRKTNLVDPTGLICLLHDTCVKYDLYECLYNFITGSSTLSKVNGNIWYL